MRDNNTFDPDNITKFDMNKIADHIEKYIDMLEEVMIIPKDMLDDNEKKINKAIKVSKKLISKLRKGDTSVFKDIDDCNLIS